ncbi:iron complex transport system substrate-binding protein [Pseudomonas duriflava]|uniref:Iron complex transport system substrate-binding protein n=1 Tax=Pseudomonas duriflava TaxID=459528 RepID=A0A562Q7L6_9PSED|nr:ABC transporter substrate-binding protein [Pseudomonas duriflava]TWI52719.1 iron complex transport system substrate-binding protein [Pseudomonas duriflava]
MRLIFTLLLTAWALLINAAHADTLPKRIVSLTWESTEDLLELGITPLAVADADDYKTWVVRPTLPDSVRSAGSRVEPNLELLAELKPDLILINPSLEGLRSKLERIASVQSFDNFRQDYNNYETARRNYLQLAEQFDRKAQAEQRLAAMDKRILELRQQLDLHFRGHPPKVTVIRFASPAVAYVYGDNSMPQYAMELLQLPPAYPLPATAWGITQKPISELGQINEGVVLHIEPFAQGEKLFSTRLWQVMPFVQNRHFAAVRSTWTYGGVFSVQYLAEALTEALLTIEP